MPNRRRSRRPPRNRTRPPWRIENKPARGKFFMYRTIVFVWLFAVSGAAYAQDGFTSLFNGKDLTGWVNVNCAPSSWYVKDNMIITTGKPTGYMRTERMYENFIAEFEWFHAPDPKGSVGNSGFFVWCDPIP